MAGRVNWNGDAFRSAVRAEIGKRLQAAAIMVENHAKQLVSVEGTGGSSGKRDERGRFIKGTSIARRYGSNPSKPGEPPHKQYGHLRRSITRDFDWTKFRARVGTNLKYGRWLELGTSRMAARPWLRRALLEKRNEVRALLMRPLSLGGRRAA